ncbi:hypothetical protein BC834DRAFT_972261 [Gloeopeniophorella convolvens]|nr:hypothetical protein BC834DRAFT_972261 [Gloeopeniophorella convolvens]
MSESSHSEPPSPGAIREHPEFSCFRDYMYHSFHQAWLSKCAEPENQPVQKLSREHLRFHNPRPRLLQYGIPITADVLIAYADQKHLWPKGKIDRINGQFFAFEKCVNYLSDLVDWTLELRSVYSVEHEMVLALYTNYELQQMAQADEDDVLNIIRKELGMSGTPMWYYDIINYDDDYLRLHGPPKIPEGTDTNASGKGVFKELAPPGSDSPASSEEQEQQ